MESRKLGKSDLDLTVIGLGTWAIGGEWAYGWGPQDDKDSLATILEALECGINWIDTAPAYGLGRSELLVGQALESWRKLGHPAPIIATKCGLVASGKTTVESCLDRASIISECNDSLKRLGVERIDLYQIHWPNPAGKIAEAYETLLELKAAGKIRWGGVSNFSAAQLNHIQKYSDVVSLQPPYSMVNRGIEEQTIPWCIEHQTGILAYSPLQAGLLTGKVTSEWLASINDGDWRKSKSDFFKNPKFNKVLAFNSAVAQTEIGTKHPLMEIAIQWVLARSGVTAAICGARRPGQIKQLVKSLSWKISEVEVQLIDQLYLELLEK
jgi:aryl-alcohol dehydrogenase-like predicted oxidoreductase